jgi:hypothetical protein
MGEMYLSGGVTKYFQAKTKRFALKYVPVEILAEKKIRIH